MTFCRKTMSTAFSYRVLTTAMVILLRLCWSKPSMFQETITTLEVAWVLMATYTLGSVTRVAWEEEDSAFSQLEEKMLRALDRSQPFSCRKNWAIISSLLVTASSSFTILKATPASWKVYYENKYQVIQPTIGTGTT